MRPSGLPLTTYIQPDLAEQLRACAKASDRSVAAEIRQAIRAHVLASTSEAQAGRPELRDNPGVELAGNVVLEA
jgi:hypothetical protein